MYKQILSVSKIKSLWGVDSLIYHTHLIYFVEQNCAEEVDRCHAIKLYFVLLNVPTCACLLLPSSSSPLPPAPSWNTPTVTM